MPDSWGQPLYVFLSAASIFYYKIKTIMKHISVWNKVVGIVWGNWKPVDLYQINDHASRLKNIWCGLWTRLKKIHLKSWITNPFNFQKIQAVFTNPTNTHESLVLQCRTNPYKSGFRYWGIWICESDLLWLGSWICFGNLFFKNSYCFRRILQP
jgi:hypothetical protein